jgi:SagB-type dehydrogenase family enzyme
MTDDYRLRSSQHLRAAAARDPQFRLPLRPRLVDDLAILPLGDGLVIDGGPQRRVLRGASVRSVLEPLLGLLDGARTADRLATASGRSRADVDGALALLYAAGAIEEGEADSEEAAPALSYLRRMADSTGVNRSGLEALRRMRAASVAVVDDAPLAERLGDAMGGLCRVIATSDGSEHADLTVVTGPDRAAALLSSLAAGAPAVLPAAANGTELSYGPLVGPDPVICGHCVADDLRAGRADDPPEPFALDLLAGLLACELTALLARVGDAPSRRQRVAVDSRTWQRALDLVPRRVSCPDCGRGGDARAVDETPYRYEQLAELPPRALLSPKEHQRHFQPANLALQERAKTYSSAPRVPAAAAGPLAEVARRCVGMRAATGGRAVDRYAPTGGNLGSAQLYLAAPTLPSLGPRAWYYDPFSDELCALPGADNGERLLAEARRCPGAAGGRTRAEATFVLTGALDRVAAKYPVLAYRIVHLDAGVSGLQAALCARARGLRPRVARRWCDENLHAILGTDADTEPVTGVIVLTREETR